MLGVLLKKDFDPKFSRLRPTLGVFVGEASINGIDNSSYNAPFPFWMMSSFSFGLELGFQLAQNLQG